MITLLGSPENLSKPLQVCIKSGEKPGVTSLLGSPENLSKPLQVSIKSGEKPGVTSLMTSLIPDNFTDSP